MKRLLLPTLLFAAISISTHAQVSCTVSAPDQTGVYPSTLTNACQHSAYSQDISFALVNDTCVNLGGPSCTDLTFNSAEITSISGLPAGLTYGCESVTCVYSKDVGTHTKGCIQVSGTPTTSGTTTATINITINYSGLNYPYTYDVDITVDANGTNGCPLVSSITDAQSVSKLTSSPNPTKGKVNFNKEVTGVIFDVMGNEILTINDSNTADLTGLNAGIYILNSNQGTIRITKD